MKFYDNCLLSYRILMQIRYNLMHFWWSSKYYRKSIKIFYENSIQFDRYSIPIELRIEFPLNCIDRNQIPIRFPSNWESNSHRIVSIGIEFLSNCIEFPYKILMHFRWYFNDHRKCIELYRICIKILMTYQTIVRKFLKST